MPKLRTSLIQRLGVAFHCVLARDIHGHEGRGQEAHDRADIGDPAEPRLPHRGQQSIGHAQDAKEVSLELLLSLRDAGLLRRPAEERSPRY